MGMETIATPACCMFSAYGRSSTMFLYFDAIDKDKDSAYTSGITCLPPNDLQKHIDAEDLFCYLSASSSFLTAVISTFCIASMIPLKGPRLLLLERQWHQLLKTPQPDDDEHTS